MKAFAAVLAGLHEAAHYASIDEFPQEVIRLLRRSINFDGAVLGMGSVVGQANPDLAISDAYLYRRDTSLLTEYPAISAGDPVTAAFVKGLAEPLRFTCPLFYAAHKLPELVAYTRRHALQELMLFGTAPSGKAASQWLVLYRGSNGAFSDEDADHLEAFWLHLKLALDVNRTRGLDNVTLNRDGRALALVNARGFIIAADVSFHRLVQEEWSGHHPVILPRPVWEAAASGGIYRGRKMEVRFSRARSHLACHASRIAAPLPELSRAESRVATLVSAGMTYKEVAHKLAISPNTVRNHLKNTYTKLGLSNKAALTLYMVSHSESMRNSH